MAGSLAKPARASPGSSSPVPTRARMIMTATTSLRMRSVARSTNAARRMAKKSRCCAVNPPGTMTHSARAMPVTLETLDGWHGTRSEDGRAPRKELHVLWTIFVVLLVLWAGGGELLHAQWLHSHSAGRCP